MESRQPTRGPLMQHSVCSHNSLNNSSTNTSVDLYTSNKHCSHDTETSQWYSDLPQTGYSTNDSNNPYWHERWDTYQSSPCATHHLEQSSLSADKEGLTNATNMADNTTHGNIPDWIVINRTQSNRLTQLMVDYIHCSILWKKLDLFLHLLNRNIDYLFLMLEFQNQ